MFNIHTEYVPGPFTEMHNVFATCDRSGRCNQIGNYVRLTKPHEADLFLLDLTVPSGERRNHFVDGAGEAMVLAKAAYNPGRGYAKDLIPTSNVTFLRWQNREIDGADIHVNGKRVGCIVEDEHGYDVAFDVDDYGHCFKAGLTYRSACNEARQMVVDANPQEANVMRQLSKHGGSCTLQLGPKWDELHDAVWNLKKLSKLHITAYDEASGIVSIAAGAKA